MKLILTKAELVAWINETQDMMPEGYIVTDVDDQDADGEWHLVVTLEEAKPDDEPCAEK